MFPRIRQVVVNALVVLCLGAPGVAFADGRFEHRGEHHEFSHRHVHRFEPYELGLWSGGAWIEGWFDGRYGWWWTAGGRRYWYDRPVYPTVVVTPPPPAAVAPPPPSPSTWYYCDNPAGYYPTVQTCAVPFRPVPAQPR